MKRYPYILLLLGQFLLIYSHDLQAQNKSCSSDPYFNKLDFWIGTWEVFDSSGKLVGTNVIRKVLNGCAIEENWTDIDGGKGQSLFYVESKDSTWHQIWVTENAKMIGGQKHKILINESSENSVIFQGGIISTINAVLKIEQSYA